MNGTMMPFPGGIPTVEGPAFSRRLMKSGRITGETKIVGIPKLSSVPELDQLPSSPISGPPDHAGLWIRIECTFVGPTVPPVILYSGVAPHAPLIKPAPSPLLSPATFTSPYILHIPLSSWSRLVSLSALLVETLTNCCSCSRCLWRYWPGEQAFPSFSLSTPN